MARQVLPIVGAAIGGYLTMSPQGAQWGYMIGPDIGEAYDGEFITIERGEDNEPA